MTQQALGAGTSVPRRRAVFGLLDADGWGWASVKAFAWLIIIIFILGYLPDRAYYLTVGRTVDLGVLAWSPINLCPPQNETLPCPAPVGALVPWHPSPPELALPAARTDGAVLQVGTKVLYIGGSDGTTAQKTVYVARTVGSGNFDKWASGPDLPAPRADASVAYVAGSIYLIGGTDETGAPTSTVFMLTPDSVSGDLGAWKAAPDTLKLPEARSAAAAAITTDGVLLIGGRNADGPVTTTWKSALDTKGGLGKWSDEQPLKVPQADATAVVIGDFVWLYGGSDASGPVGAVQRGSFGKAAAAGLPANPLAGKVTQWDVSNNANLPVARTNAAGWGANGTLYLAGGDDGSGPKSEVYWAIPTTTGDLTEWKHLKVGDLPAPGLEGAAAVITGPNAVLVGGATVGGVLASSARANTSPQSPFFQVGLVGATVPGLKIDGEIGQQLGYMNAAGVGTVDFIILLLIGWAFAHKEQARAIVGRVLRRGPR
jgi:N-acetylneuraminic acid mutarotase